ncbi:MAG: hypothetical protein RLY71_3818 [Pseudomonadota bacterium]|jgi:hypothetical protein
MSIFGKIRDAIFGKKDEAASAAPADASVDVQVAQADTAAAPAAPVALSEVDVEAVLTGLAEQAGQKLNWRTSIVDLMKLLGMDSSLAERRALAAELGYSGDPQDSAAMNIWLHKQVMQKLAENGGKVPADLLD